MRLVRSLAQAILSFHLVFHFGFRQSSLQPRLQATTTRNSLSNGARLARPSFGAELSNSSSRYPLRWYCGPVCARPVLDRTWYFDRVDSTTIRLSGNMAVPFRVSFSLPVD
ncbi:unnamed protein product [Periconia digitata]|uniref:Uncharacterized protein n=1 Tax=Periconia digitata TaxID=1303443 RepID=A0A9W4UF48_9PLEO|nr:unnamed protein product [Periconia digitata]